MAREYSSATVSALGLYLFNGRSAKFRLSLCRRRSSRVGGLEDFKVEADIYRRDTWRVPETRDYSIGERDIATERRRMLHFKRYVYKIEWLRYRRAMIIGGPTARLLSANVPRLRAVRLFRLVVVVVVVIPTPRVFLVVQSSSPSCETVATNFPRKYA